MIITWECCSLYSQQTHERIFMEIILCQDQSQDIASHMENELWLLMQTWKIAGPFMGRGAARKSLQSNNLSAQSAIFWDSRVSSGRPAFLSLSLSGHLEVWLEKRTVNNPVTGFKTEHSTKESSYLTDWVNLVRQATRLPGCYFRVCLICWWMYDMWSRFLFNSCRDWR